MNPMLRKACASESPDADRPRLAGAPGNPRHIRVAAIAVATVALALACPFPALGDDDVVRFVAPRNLSTALGETELELRLAAPDGLRVLRVELTVDGVPLTVLDGPPWKTTWDAGDGSRGHRIVANAYLSDGSTARAVLNTSALRINQVEKVDLVNLYVLVRSRDGRYVTDLTREDFELTENGRPQTISRFSTEGKPLRIAIVLDISLSMGKGGRLESAQKAALEFLGALQPGDQAMVVTFADEVRLPEDLSEDRAELASTIREAEAFGGTALYDAVWRTANRLGEFDGRRVLVLLSDGRDEAANGLEPGSLHTLGEALDQALRKEVMIFAIGLGKELESLDFYQRETAGAILTRLAEETGGRVLFLKRAGQLKKAFQDVALDLRHQYSVAYSSDDTRRDGKWRRIRLTVPGRDAEVITRKGYFAPKDGDETDALFESGF